MAQTITTNMTKDSVTTTVFPMSFTILPQVPAAPLTEEQLELFPAHVELAVMWSDIRNGVGGDSHMCAVAIAARRRFDGVNVRVGHHVVVIDGMTHYHDKTGALEKFVTAYDHIPRLVLPTTIPLTRCAHQSCF